MSTAKQPTAEPGTTAEAGRVRVLCFGDSLTSGHCSGGLKQHPYSQRLADLLTRALPGKSVEVLTNGVPGDVASSPRFHQRLQRQCKFSLSQEGGLRQTFRCLTPWRSSSIEVLMGTRLFVDGFNLGMLGWAVVDK